MLMSYNLAYNVLQCHTVSYVYAPRRRVRVRVQRHGVIVINAARRTVVGGQAAAHGPLVPIHADL